jgi:hypothetical protein
MAYIKFKPLTGIYEFFKKLDASDLTEEELRFVVDDETIIMAFKAVRDICIFTDKRLIIIDYKGWRNWRQRVISVQYNSISSYSLNVRMIDTTIELTTDSSYKLALNFSKPIPLDDMFIMYQYLTKCILKETK